jgi:hypothetical protein
MMNVQLSRESAKVVTERLERGGEFRKRRQMARLTIRLFARRLFFPADC